MSKDLEAMIKSAASAASLGFAGERRSGLVSCIVRQCRHSGPSPHQIELELTEQGQNYCAGTTKRRIKEAVIKSAASAASLGLAGERPVPRHPRARPPLAADLITAS